MLKAILVTCGLFAAGYVMLAFAIWELNPANWGEYWRAALAILPAIFSAPVWLEK